MTGWKPRHYYILKHRLTGKMYIGQRVSNDVGKGYFGSGKYWNRHRKQHGWLDIDVIELHFFENKKDAQLWLDDQKVKFGEYWKGNLFANLIPETVDDKASQLGFKHSDETRQRMSLVRSGRSQMGGVKQHSVESKMRMSDKRKGRILSEEDKRRKSIALAGIPKSEAHKQAMRKEKRKVNCPLCDRLLGSHNLHRHLKACELKYNLKERNGKERY